jgi:pantoate--beta-alanine ligase
MQIVHSIFELRQQVAAWRRADERIALVPTMGNLHAGHLDLVHAARAEAERRVVSIFVNPTQFGPLEDFDNYPRTLVEDSRELERAEVDLLFAPSVSEVYPRGLGSLTQVEVPNLSRTLCGLFRPGHFEGVALVVTKLLNMVQPDVAVFGEKDRQQLMVIRRLVDDLNMPVKILGVATKRHLDGLAMSSRNAYLSPPERAVAPTLYGMIKVVAERLQTGDRNFHTMQEAAKAALEEAGFRVDYFEVRRAEDLGEPAANDTELLVLAAARLGGARLIDNCLVTLPGHD